MKTPGEHLDEASKVLEKVSRILAGQRDVPVDILVKVANAHITLALAINAVPLVSDLRDEMRDARDPYRDVIDRAIRDINELP